MYCWKKFPVALLNLLRKIFAFIALTIVLFCPLCLYADPVAQIIGAPTGLTNQTNPIISIAGDGVVAYKYKLDGGDYSDEIAVNTNITFSADVTIFGKNADVPIFEKKFIAGEVPLQDLLDERADFIDSVDFDNVAIDTPVVFLLNKERMTLESDNILYVEGSNIDQLDVYMNDSPTIPAVIVNQSLSGGNGYITYEVKTDTPETDFIRIINRSIGTVSFKIINLNNMLFASDDDVLSEIQALPPEYGSEPMERKVWRFIRDNRYHWYPLSYDYWTTSSPALFFNSIGFGFCGDSATLYCQLMTLLGYQTRIWWLIGHVVPEVLINGKWEMYDPDIEVYYYNYQGEVAGVEELAADPSLITNPINPLPNAPGFAYSQTVADIYSSSANNTVYDWYYDDTIQNYLLNLQIPADGIFEFPAVFAAPIHTLYDEDAPFYTNARLTIPRGWAGTLSTPLITHSIGYEGPHTLSVIARDSAGNWQTDPTVVSWTTDSWPPLTTLYQSNATDPVTLTVNEPATIYYTIDGSTPTTSSAVYNGPVSISPSTLLKFFAIDLAGNRENVKSYIAPVTGVSLTTDKNSPQVQGAVITFTAAASGGSGTYEYYYMFRNPKTGQWSHEQAYSGNPVRTWNTAGADPGTYSIQVWARSAGSTETYEASKSISYMINPQPAVTGVSLMVDKSSPQVQGAVIKFTAAASGGSGTYEYRFVLRSPNAAQWSLGQAYSGNPVWQWNTTGVDPGTYSIMVWARSAGSTAAYEAWKEVAYTINPPPVTGVTVTTDKSSPQAQGALITFTAAASGGSGTYEYYFTLRNPKTGEWIVGQAYSGNPVWQWNTTGIDTGTYSIMVWARSTGSTAEYEAWKEVAYTINPPPITGLSLTTDKSSPQAQGALITFTAAASGGSGTYEYYFTLWNPKTGEWIVGQAYSGNPVWQWNTTGIDTGTYSIQVWARSAGSTAEYEAWKEIAYTINPPPSQ